MLWPRSRDGLVRAAVLAAVPLVLQANEHLRDDPLAVGHSTSSIDSQDIASLNMVGGP
jgi:hypothetical protein